MELLRFSAESYIKLHDSLSKLQSDLNGDEVEQFPDATDLTGNALPLGDSRKGDAQRLLKYSRMLCTRINLRICVKHIDELLRSVEGGWLGANALGALMANVTRELSCQLFVGIAPERQDLYENGRAGWDEIIAAFPASGDDVEEMNKCYALCRYPATVFHSLMVVEHGLVALGKRLGVTDPKEGWDATFRELDKIVKAGHSKNHTGLNFEFLQQLHTCVEAMKLAWRNKVNHATGKPLVMSGGFAPVVAEEIVTASRGFMRRLVEGIP